MLSLVGLPGSGKSTVGRQLAAQWGCNFCDSDAAIEQRIGCSIRDFFSHQGEAAFRAIEEQVIDELLVQQPGVLATGGGAILSSRNRQVLHQKSQVIYLHARPEDLARRLRHDRVRPLLNTPDPLQRLRELYEIRDPLYREAAHRVIDTAGLTLRRLVQQLAEQAVEQVPTASEPTISNATTHDRAPS